MSTIDFKASTRYYKQNKKFLKSAPLKFNLINFPFWLIAAIRRQISIMLGLSISRDEFDSRVEERLNGISDACYEFLGVDKSQTAIIKPIRFYDIADDWDIINYNKKEDKFRASKYCATVFLFSDRQLYYYDYKFSMIGPDYSEESGELFYQDITNIGVKHEEYLVEEAQSKKGGFFGKVFARLKPKTGRAVESHSVALFTFTDSPVIRARFTDMPDTRASIHGMKQLIREKRSD
ncbi:MAG: hypothetical protein LBP26_00015 [Clostridiales bacterium]|jgi:hypothetical protein|nr:hypothetical protein [Clostridiales bacterium]